MTPLRIERLSLQMALAIGLHKLRLPEPTALYSKRRFLMSIQESRLESRRSRGFIKHIPQRLSCFVLLPIHGINLSDGHQRGSLALLGQ